MEECGPHIVYIKGVDNIVSDAISRLDYDKKVNTRNSNAHVRNMSLVKLCNGYVKKTSNSKAFQTDDMYVPTGTHTFTNQLEFARANYSIITFMPCEDHERNAQSETYDNQVKHHLKYLFVNTSAKDEVRYIQL